MPVNYLTLTQEIKKLGEQSLQRSVRLSENLNICRELLRQNASQTRLLEQKVEEAVARDSGIRCAKPCGENLDTHRTAQSSDELCTILAADGSQITPNAHEPVLFGLVNVGIFRMPLNAGGIPEEFIESELLYDDRLYANGGLISEDFIALQRDVREREKLAELVDHERQLGEAAPIITLTDGPLELYHEPRMDKQFGVMFARYLDALDRLSLLGAVTAGYVDRPRADLVVRLLELVEAGSTAEALDERPFTGVTDLNLFEDLLAPGERSAVFELQSSSTKSYSGKKALHFFYLNVGRQQKSAIARVEIPAWVAEDAPSLDLLQHVLVDQAHTLGSRPYPYPLLRAHEIAVVKLDDRDQLTQRIEQELLQQGFDPFEKSNKQSGKESEPRTRN
ncbi:MAG TPA: hypothetical protein DDW19_07865 [Anaerolineaceae bacterium]|jgi:hypothetical protein|nr:hypothetical protein [Anaerolineaceae bacterium]